MIHEHGTIPPPISRVVVALVALSLAAIGRGALAQPVERRADGYYAIVPVELVMHASEREGASCDWASEREKARTWGRQEVRIAAKGPYTERQIEAFDWPRWIPIRTVFSDGTSAEGIWFENATGVPALDLWCWIASDVRWDGEGYRLRHTAVMMNVANRSNWSGNYEPWAPGQRFTTWNQRETRVGYERAAPIPAPPPRR